LAQLVPRLARRDLMGYRSVFTGLSGRSKRTNESGWSVMRVRSLIVSESDFTEDPDGFRGHDSISCNRTGIWAYYHLKLVISQSDRRRYVRFRFRKGEEADGRFLGMVDFLVNVKPHPCFPALHGICLTPRPSLFFDRIEGPFDQSSSFLPRSYRLERATVKAMAVFGLASVLLHVHSQGRIWGPFHSDDLIYDSMGEFHFVDFPCERFPLRCAGRAFMAPGIFHARCQNEEYKHSNFFKEPSSQRDDMLTYAAAVYSIDSGKEFETGQLGCRKVQRSIHDFCEGRVRNCITELVKACYVFSPESAATAARVVKFLLDYNEPLFPGMDMKQYSEYRNRIFKATFIGPAEARIFAPSPDAQIQYAIFREENRVSSQSPLVSNWIRDFDRFHQVQVLSRTSSATVKRMLDGYPDGTSVVVKTYEVPANSLIDFPREIEILIQLAHPCIVSLFGFSPPSSTHGFQIGTFDTMGPSLKSVLEDPRPPVWWTSSQKVISLLAIIFGMIFTHARKVMHRDLKPSNLVFDREHYLQICDFGSSRFTNLDETLTKEVGTPFYMAPELYEEGGYTEKIDVYSFGLIMYEIVVGSRVYPGSLTKAQLLRRVISGVRADIPVNVKPWVKSLIERCWDGDPEVRPSFSQILQIFGNENFMVFDDVNPLLTWTFFDAMTR
jgi:serine/threonine protein kinase